MTEHTAAIIGAACGLLGAWYVAEEGKRAGWGFVAFLASNVAWLTFAVHAGQWALFAQHAGFAVLSVRGVLKKTRRAAPIDAGETQVPEHDLRTLWLAEHARVQELERLINTPRIDDFFDAVRLEAAHQQVRWGSAHDAGKEPHDWFWLLGYLSGKALASFGRGDRDKGLHHIVSSAASLLNWHRHATRQAVAMRPGIEPPSDELSTAEGMGV